MDHLSDAIQGVINLLDMLGGAVRRILSGAKHSTKEEWRSRDNTWVGVAVLVVQGLFVVFLVGCGEPPDPKGPSTSIGSDSTEIPEQAEEPATEPSLANAVAREVVAGNIPAHLDEVLVQSMIDSLASPLPATRMLQAQAMTRLWPKADGAVAESMGLACKDYMMEHTREYFALIPELIDQQASSSIWSDMIAQELMIDDENGPLEAADAFATALHAKAREQGASLDNVDQQVPQVGSGKAHGTDYRTLTAMLSTDQMHRKVNVPAAPQRIISLVPSQTELLYDLGLGERVVGITKFCVHPESWFKTKHRVGGTKKVDMDKVRALKPDLIIGNKEENERKDIQTLEKEFPVWMSDVRDLESAVEMIRQVGELTGTKDKAEALSKGITDAFAKQHYIDPPLTVAYLIWREPFMVAGHGTFVNDMLKRSGLQNVFDEGDARYPEITPQELAESDPDLILLSSEPYPFKEKHIQELNMICPGTPVKLVDGEMFSWYGSRLLQAPAYFSGLLSGWAV